MPDKYVAKDISKAIAEKDDLENLRILLLRAEVANPELPKLLEDAGAIVDDVAVYQTVPETEDVTGAAARLLESGADWLTFASSSAVENFHARFNLPELLGKFPATRIASIGPETTKALVALGLKPTVEAKPHTIDGLVKAVRG
jgi:uroporphyrinogen III methyltransferase/synthase